MNRLLQLLPPVKYMIILTIVCLVVGVIAAGGMHPKALFGLLVAAGIIALVALRNSDPIAWEAYHDPHAYSLRLQRDAVAIQLRALVYACESGDSDLVVYQIAQSRNILADLGVSITDR